MNHGPSGTVSHKHTIVQDIHNTKEPINHTCVASSVWMDLIAPAASSLAAPPSTLLSKPCTSIFITGMSGGGVDAFGHSMSSSGYTSTVASAAPCGHVKSQ